MKSLSYLNKYFLRYKWRLILGVLFIVISNYFGVQMPLFVKEAVDEMLSTQKTSSLEDLILLSLKVGGIYMLLSLISGFFLFLTRQTIIVMSRHIEFDLKNEIYAHYQQMDFQFFNSHKVGDLMNRISEDVSQVRMYLGPGIMYSINLIALSALVIGQMVQINAMLTLLVLIPLPIMSYLIYVVSSRMNKLSKEVQAEQSQLSAIVQESFSGIRVIKAYLREENVRNRFDDSAENYKGRVMGLVRVNAFFMPTIVFLIGLSTLLAIYVGGLMNFSGKISPGGILAFVFFVNKLTWPFASIGWVTSIIQRASASQSRINDFLDTKPAIFNPNNALFDFKGKVDFKNVHFSYPTTGIEVLSGLNLTIPAGSTVGIIGKTGSGKSTILKLLMRQMDPDQGQILVDDQELKVINLHDYRTHCGIAPQEVFLFSDTIANNIMIGSEQTDIPDQKVTEVAKLAHVHHNISDFPDGYQTLLGERGVNLSGGQKQRISIARALLRNPTLLVLDDCFSAVDTETENTILENISTLNKQKQLTTLIVSHRISSLSLADKIYVLEHGKIAEEGTHEELLALNGQYKTMFIRQMQERDATD
jgi:ATP-binding cassette subfamily B protein